MNNQQNILVTGVSTGIGYAIVEKMIAEGYFVYGSVRKKQDAQRLQARFGNNFHPLLFDVTDDAAIERAETAVSHKLNGTGLSALINNAGIVIEAPLKHLKIEELEHQFKVNVFGLLKVTQTFLPLLGGDLNTTYEPGIIINVSSVSGLINFPFVGAYSASKFAVESLTDTLRRELDIYGIDVVSINPGAVKTPIWGKGKQESHLTGTDYAPFAARNAKQVQLNAKRGLEPATIANAIYKIIGQKNPQPNTILMKGKFVFSLLLTLPKRWQDKVIHKMRG